MWEMLVGWVDWFIMWVVCATHATSCLATTTTVISTAITANFERP